MYTQVGITNLLVNMKSYYNLMSDVFNTFILVVLYFEQMNNSYKFSHFIG